MDTTSEKLFNDALYNCETLGAGECAEISELLELEADEAVFPDWRPLHNGGPMELTSKGFKCPVTNSWKSRTNLQWIHKDTPYTYAGE